jgi:hypothetical protein
MLVDGGFTGRYDYALQSLSGLPYKWREYDPEDDPAEDHCRRHRLAFSERA